MLKKPGQQKLEQQQYHRNINRNTTTNIIDENVKLQCAFDELPNFQNVALSILTVKKSM